MVLWSYEKAKHVYMGYCTHRDVFINRGRSIMSNYLGACIALVAVGFLVYVVTYVQVITGSGERISAYQYREQSLQYQEDIRDTLDEIKNNRCK